MKNQLKIYRALSITAVIIFAYVLFSKVIPEYFFFFELISDYNTTAELLERESNWKERTIQLKREINKIEKQIEEINIDIPSGRELSKPLQILDSLIIKNKIQLEKLQVVGIDTANQYQLVELKVHVKSRFANLSKFSREIENGSLIFIVKSIKMKLQSMYRREVSTELSLDVLLKRQE